MSHNQGPTVHQLAKGCWCSDNKVPTFNGSAYFTTFIGIRPAEDLDPKIPHWKIYYYSIEIFFLGEHKEITPKQ
jgi:hypothetical protein